MSDTTVRPAIMPSELGAPRAASTAIARRSPRRTRSRHVAFRPVRVLLTALAIVDRPGLGVPRLLDDQLLAAAEPHRCSRSSRRSCRSAARSTTTRTCSTDGSFFSALGISLSVTLIAVFFCLLFAFLAAVAISRFRFRGRKSFVLAVLIVQMLPAEGLFIAQYKMVVERRPAELDHRRQHHLHRGRRAVHGLDAARLRRRHPGRPRGGGDGRRPQPHAGVHAHHLPAARSRARRRPASSRSCRRGTSSPSRSCCCRPRRCTRCRCGCAASSRPAPRARPTGARSWPRRPSSRVPVIIFFLIVQGRMTSGLVSGAVKG